MPPPANEDGERLELGIPGFQYTDLHDPARLADLHEAFCARLQASDPGLGSEYMPWIRGEAKLPRPAESDLLIRVGRHVSEFVGDLFGIREEMDALMARTGALDPIFRFKRDFMVRRASKRASKDGAAGTDFQELERAVEAATLALWAPDAPPRDPEVAVAGAVSRLLDLAAELAGATGKTPKPVRPETFDAIAQLEKRLPAQAGRAGAEPAAFIEDILLAYEAWAARILADEHLHRSRAAGWVSFRLPEKLHFPDGLVEIERPDPEFTERIHGPLDTRRRRDGFGLTDPRWSGKEALDHAHYCILCHDREKDSCTRGYPLPRPSFEGGKNPLGIVLNGCPLDERISEMHALRRTGDSVAALAVAMVDNPMCPATGHRICNDCMKACIFQKQEPVNIPQIETNVLVEVLDLPWGLEVYGLLTRWNPLCARRPYALPYNGKNVLVVGLGPAGINLAQWLLNEGFGVVGIDGLKIEPLAARLTGAGGKPPAPIRDWSSVKAPLDERITTGFGGVAEYGITVRWDKNFLTVMDVTLRRRPRFRVYGGVRFGGTVTIDDAWKLGFDHIAIAAGAGRPTVVEMKNTLIRNVRTASDFLMALQLTGAYKKSSLANLQLELPCVVIGSGLTAIDTATEAMAYYPVQVERILERHEVLSGERGEEAVRAGMTPGEIRVLDVFLEHGRAIREERERARLAGEAPNFIPLLESWGGVKICYRKRMVDSPAYRLNHEEIIQCFQEGVEFLENLNPIEAIPDASGAVAAVVFERMVVSGGEYRGSGDTVRIPARSVFMAAGTTPNIIYEKEHPGTFAVDRKRRSFQPHRLGTKDGRPALEPAAATLADPGFFTSYEKDGKLISFFGDNHPVYAGSVVKAMASAKDGVPHIAKLFAEEISGLRPEDAPARERAWKTLIRTLDDGLIARVVEVVRLTPTVVEVIVRAPLQARGFHPGQFYRLQNYETNARLIDGTRLQMEGIALTGAWVDAEKGLLSLIVLEMGASSRLCALLEPGEEVVVMGPTGTPTEIPAGELVILCGGGLGNAVLFSVAHALRAAGSRVVYFAGYKKPEDLFHRGEIEAGCDQVIWSVDMGRAIEPGRPQDLTFTGNIVEAMRTYAEGRLGTPLFDLRKAKRLISIGSDRMMAAVTRARKGVLAPHLDPAHVAVSSINSPMQCMMKEICGQCLQRHLDPATGEPTSYVFSCFNQDQPSDCVDWTNLNERLRMNTLEEKLANLWLTRILARAEARRESTAVEARS